MAEKTFTNIRLGLKVDTLENWGNSSLVLKRGELAFATVAASAGTGLTEPVVMVKIGDGEHTFKDLAFDFYANAADVLSACKSEAGLKAFVNGVIADAGIASSSAMEALAKRVTDAEGEIDTLQTEMDAVEVKAAANEAAITAIEGRFGADTVALEINAAINALNLAGTYEAKGEAAKVSTALETYKTSNDAKILEHTNAISANAGAITAIKDGETIDSFKDVETALAGKEAAGAAASALAEAKTYADGLAVNYDAKGSAATAEANAKAYADGLAGNYDAAGTAAQALTDAKDYTDSELTRLVGDKTVGTQITTAIDGLDLANTYDAKGAAAAVETKLNTHASEAAAAYETKTDAAAKLTEAKGYTDTEVAKVQGEVDALEAYVGTIPTDYTEETVIAYINKKAEETLAAAQGGSSETAASVKQQLDNYKSENDTRVKAAEDAIDAIEADYLKAEDKTELQNQITALDGLVGDKAVAEQITDVTDPLAARVKAVEDDYLKAADKTELQEQITTNANAIERLTNGVSAEEVDGVNDLIQYVKDHGTEVTGIKADIKANAEAINAIEADYLKAADKTELAGDITALEGRMDAAETAIGTKATQTDLEAAVARIGTAEGKITTLEGEMDAAQADIDALELKVGDKAVAEQITDVTNPLAERVVALEAVDHSHANAAELDKIAEGDKAKWDAKLEDVTAAADSGLKATKTGNTVAIAIDDSITFVFDCGTSAV